MGKVIQRKGKARKETKGLLTIRPNVAGIDIGSRQMHVCGPQDADGQVQLAVFDTTTVDIQACAKWLKQLGVVSIAMESTGVYWIAPFELLESDGFEVLLVDTRPLSRVPGRKTDVTDCEWIQSLHSCGLLQGCYRPSDAISQLRSIVRMKAVLVSDHADWLRRIQKCLDQMNVRVHHAVAQISGTTGMAIVRAIVAGERDPAKLAELRDPRCQKSKEQITEYLTGHWRPDHLFNLQQALEMYDMLSAKLETYERQIQDRLKELTPAGSENKKAPPLQNRERTKAMKRRNEEEKRQELFRMSGVDLTTIDGVGVETAEAIVSEYGIDLSKFPNEKQFIAHVQLAPRKPVSGGKPLNKRPRKTKGTRVGKALQTAAIGVSRGPTALGAYYRRISRHKGATIAVFATARKIGSNVYRLLRWGQPYVDQGQQVYEARHQAARLRSVAATADQLGMKLVPKTHPQVVDATGGLR
jgi:transposase